jgi:hypothetical protein
MYLKVLLWAIKGADVLMEMWFFCERLVVHKERGCAIN